MSNDISNDADIIDSRDIVGKIEELESDIECYEEDIEGHRDEIVDLEDLLDDYTSELELLDEEETDRREELENLIDSCKTDITSIESLIEEIEQDIKNVKEELDPLKSLEEDAAGYCPDWRYGSALIRDSYFVDYAKELVSDIGDLPRNLPSYIENNIDWEGVADDLKQDYTSVDFEGVEYWIR